MKRRRRWQRFPALNADVGLLFSWCGCGFSSDSVLLVFLLRGCGRDPYTGPGKAHLPIPLWCNHKQTHTHTFPWCRFPHLGSKYAYAYTYRTGIFNNTNMESQHKRVALALYEKGICGLRAVAAVGKVGYLTNEWRFAHHHRSNRCLQLSRIHLPFAHLQQTYKRREIRQWFEKGCCMSSSINLKVQSSIFRYYVWSNGIKTRTVGKAKIQLMFKGSLSLYTQFFLDLYKCYISL